MRKAFSVWVCLEPGPTRENTISRFTLGQHDLEGSPRYDRSTYDLIEVVLICLGKPGMGTGVLGMLNTLFAEDMSPDVKIAAMQRLEMIPRLVARMGMTLAEALDFVDVSEPAECERYASLLGASGV